MAAAEDAVRTRRGWGLVGAVAAALGACAVCCAGPLLAVLGGLSIASLAASVWVPALAVVAVVAGGVIVVVLRRRRRASCAVPAQTVDLGLPVRGPEQDG
ncbi:hypothetical protein [Kribbella endophytica]